MPRICMYFWNDSVDESWPSNFSPSRIYLMSFVLVWFYMICNTRCFHASSLFVWIMLLLHENPGPWEINGRFITIFSGTRIIIPFGLQILHLLPLESPPHSISLFDSLISEDRVPSSASMRGGYLWPFDICLLCKGEIKAEKESAWSLPGGPDVWIENHVSHYFSFSCYPMALLGIWAFLILQEHLDWFC